MAEILGSKYEGEMQQNWPHGEGTYTYANGVVYKGSFDKGNFHGKGILTYINGDRLEGQWENGKLIEKQFFFADGLAYEKNWDYCDKLDRRFHSEKEGFRAFPDTLGRDGEDVKENFPEGTYGELTRHWQGSFRSNQESAYEL